MNGRRTGAIGLVLAVVLLLSGCVKWQSEPDYTLFDMPFEMTADFTRGSVTGSFLYERTSAQNSTLTFLSPETLAGMVLCESDDLLTSEYNGIVCEQDWNSVKGGNPIRALSAVFQAYKTEQPIGTEAENGETAFELQNGMQMVMYCGQLRQIVCPAEELIITVTGFTETEP